jgi:hypothetical protein
MINAMDAMQLITVLYVFECPACGKKNPFVCFVPAGKGAC